MGVLLVTVPPLPIKLIDSSSRRNMAMYDRDQGYFLRSEPQALLQSLNVYQCPSTNTIQQTGGGMAKDNLVLVFIYNVYCSTMMLVFFQSRVSVKSLVQFYFSLVRSIKCGAVNAYFHGSLVFMWWRKTGDKKFFVLYYNSYVPPLILLFKTFLLFLLKYNIIL